MWHILQWDIPQPLEKKKEWNSANGNTMDRTIGHYDYRHQSEKDKYTLSLKCGI